MQPTNQTVWKPTDLHITFIGVLKDENLKRLRATNPNLLNELNTTILADVDIAPIMRNPQGELFMQLEGEYFPLIFGKWIQEEKVTFVDNTEEYVEYNCMMDVKGIHYLFVLEPEEQLNEIKQ
jgi:hypothetical protein